MTRLLTLPILGIAACMASCRPNIVTGKGAIVTESRTISSFSKIDAEVPMDMVVTVDARATPSFSINGYENLLKLVRTEIKDNKLRIFFPPKTYVDNDKKLKAMITVPSLSALELTGAVNADIRGQLSGEKFDLEMTGASETSIASLTVDKFSVDISGAGKLNVNGGKVREANYDASGACELHTYSLIADAVDLDVAGAGSAEVYAVSRLSGDISGAASVDYKGNPKLETETSGASSISKVD